MSQEEQKVTITMLKGEFIHPEWREEGTVHDVEKTIADRWVRHGSAEYGGEAGKVVVTVTHQLGDFPGAQQFADAGITTIAAVKALIAEKGDAWPKSVKGITKAVAGKVSEALEALAAVAPGT